MNTISNNLSKILLAGLVAMLFVGCDSLFNDGEIRYDGPTQVEFKPTSQSLTLGSNQGGTLSVNVQLIGEQRSQDLPLSFVVVDEETTAEEGVDYSLPSTSVTIPADSSSAAVDITVSGQDLNTGEQVSLVLELQGNSDQNVQAAEELKRYTLTLLGGS